MNISGWQITCFTNEFPRLGWVKKSNPVEFGNSPIRDKHAREDYIRELLRRGEVFEVKAITNGRAS